MFLPALGKVMGDTEEVDVDVSDVAATERSRGEKRDALMTVVWLFG